MAIIQQQVEHYFSNRSGEIAIVADRVQALQGRRPVFQCVLNFYGIPGVGKSTLISEICRLALSGDWPAHKLKPMIAASIDLQASALVEASYLAGPTALASLAKQIEKQTGVISQAFHKDFANFRQLVPFDPQDEEAWYRARQAAKRMADSFTQYVYDRVKEPGLAAILLFDNSETLEPETFDWLEFEILSPLVQTDRVLLILAGSSPVRWKRFEVRRRVYLGKLRPPADRVEIVQHQAPSWSRVAPNIVQLTFGLPTANETVVEALDKIPEPQKIDAVTFDTYRPQLMERLITDLVEKRLWRNVDEELWPVFRLVAPLRQFDVTTLRNVLPKLEPEQFAGLGGNQYLLMLNQLIDTRLVEWSTERKAYILDDTLRHILALDMETRALPQAVEVHHIAAEIYEGWLAEANESRSSYLVEWLYHCAKGYQLRGQDQLVTGSKISDKLRQLLVRYYRPDGELDERTLDSASRLINELGRDDELVTLIGKQARDDMIRAVRDIVPLPES
jgi:hypothetical protein